MKRTCEETDSGQMAGLHHRLQVLQGVGPDGWILVDGIGVRRNDGDGGSFQSQIVQKQAEFPCTLWVGRKNGNLDAVEPPAANLPEEVPVGRSDFGGPEEQIHSHTHVRQISQIADSPDYPTRRPRAATRAGLRAGSVRAYSLYTTD